MRPMSGSSPEAGDVGKLERAREWCRERAWTDAHTTFLCADKETILGAEDLELFAMAAYLVGRDAEYLETLERAYNAHLSAGESPAAIRCAFWIGFRLLMRGERGSAGGWFARARRLLEREERECA